MTRFFVSSPFSGESSSGTSRREKSRCCPAAFAPAALVSAALLLGCGGEQSLSPSQRANVTSQETQTLADQALLNSAVNTLEKLPNLINLDAFVTPERAVEFRQRLEEWVRSGDPPFFWEPTPEERTLLRTQDLLEQWVRTRPTPADWMIDPLIAGLPEEYRQLPSLALLDRNAFGSPDLRVLQGAIWCRAISSQARSSLPPADQNDELKLAGALFDWTVRNLQLDPDENAGTVPHLPWQSLLYGRGTARERAWVFVHLARQQGLDVVLLEITPRGIEGAPPVLLAALVGGGELYLYEPRLGMAVPSADPAGSRRPADLTLRKPAGLTEAGDVDLVWRQLDLDAEHPYPLHAEDLKQVTAFIESGPAELSKRMRILETNLAGEHKLRLTAQTRHLAERLSKHARIKETRLWHRPFETLVRLTKLTREERNDARAELGGLLAVPTLYQGRIGHLSGLYEGEKGALQLYLGSRPPVSMLNSMKGEGAPPEQRAVMEMQVKWLWHAKQTANYFLGNSAHDRGEFGVAIDYFGLKILQENWPETRWFPGAKYGLARACEAFSLRQELAALEKRAAAERRRQQAERQRALAEQETAAGNDVRARLLTREADRLRASVEELLKETAPLEKEAVDLRIRAVQWLESDGDSPQRHGNLLRAKWLKTEIATAAAGA